MNISRIRQMASQGDMSTNAVRYLLDCHGECEHLDYKESFELETDYGVASFAKDVLAMKNIGGGYILIGVQDKTWIPVGLRNRLDIDTKILRDKVRKGTGLDIEVDIVQHEIYANSSLRLIAIILVRASTKRSKLRVPSIAKTNFYHKENWGIQQGVIYIRVGDATKRISEQAEPFVSI